jgi:hypothetical protein
MRRKSTRATGWTTGIRGALGAALLIGPGCAIGVQRDLSATTPQEIVYDDMCGVQDYYDALEAGAIKAPTLARASDVEDTQGRVSPGGLRAYLFESEFQLKTLRRVLAQNWRKVPDSLMKSEAVLIEVHWSQRAGVPRVVTEEDASIEANGQSWSLAYHPCLTELLFGESLYRTRRAMLGLPPVTPVAPLAPTAPGAVPAIATAAAAFPGTPPDGTIAAKPFVVGTAPIPGAPGGATAVVPAAAPLVPPPTAEGTAPLVPPPTAALPGPPVPPPAAGGAASPVPSGPPPPAGTAPPATEAAPQKSR